MKTITQSVVISILGILLLTSCEEVSYSEVLDTKQVFTFEVKANDWQANTDHDGLNLFYSCNFKIKGLNTGVSLNRCAVLAYINFGNYEQPLPYIRHYENTFGELWTRTVDFDYSLKEVNFYVTNSDFAVERPEKMYFRLVYIW